MAEIRNTEKDFQIALDYLTEAIEVKDEVNHRKEHSEILLSVITIYFSLGNIRDRSINLQKAKGFIDHYFAIQKDKETIEYAKAKNDLGIYYRNLAIIDDYDINLKNAIKEHIESLEIKKKFIDKYPENCVKSLNNIGNTYYSLYDVLNKKDDLYEAIKYYKKALDSEKKESRARAIIKRNLANTYVKLAEDDSTDAKCKKENIIEALNIFDDLLKYFDHKQFPFEYARSLNYLGYAYLIYSGIEDSEKNIDKAIKSIKEALRFINKNRYPEIYADFQNNLGKAYNELANKFNREMKEQAAIDSCKALFKFIDNKDTINQQDIQHCFHDMYTKLSAVRDYEMILKYAFEACEEAITIRTKNEKPLDYAETQINLGNYFSNLAKIRDEEINKEKSIEAYSKALEIFPKDNYPEKHNKIKKMF